MFNQEIRQTITQLALLYGLYSKVNDPNFHTILSPQQGTILSTIYHLESLLLNYLEDSPELQAHLVRQTPHGWWQHNFPRQEEQDVDYDD